VRDCSSEFLNSARSITLRCSRLLHQLSAPSILEEGASVALGVNYGQRMTETKTLLEKNRLTFLARFHFFARSFAVARRWRR
jgi:hypothetical protein